ncbi:hypothetical protein F1559_004984 [Cyanidiococcus yangmingshanensis]|uniref:Uncharacterized protein n=1 Tax=Cyanidiococcus yangmingshanensis TaxID=2690220 RepID=A0A7J7IST6_9RHOD|nr:hypothetical protein F1559_004984 [Cyanidiococcus yangmingshanensis]
MTAIPDEPTRYSFEAAPNHRQAVSEGVIKDDARALFRADNLDAKHAYWIVVEALRRGRLGALLAGVSFGPWLGLGLTARTWFAARALRLWVLTGTLSMPCFLLGVLAGSDWYATTRKRSRKSVAALLLASAGATHVAANQALLFALCSGSSAKTYRISMPGCLFIGAFTGASYWLAIDRMEGFALELPLLAVGRVNRFLQTLRSMRYSLHRCYVVLKRSWILYGPFLGVVILFAFLKTNWRQLLMLGFILVQLIASWSVALPIIRIVMSTPVVFELLQQRVSKGTPITGLSLFDQLRPAIESKSGEAARQRSKHAWDRAKRKPTSSSPVSFAPFVAPRGEYSGEWLLLMLEQSLHFHHVDMFLFALYDLERVALVAPARRRALFNDPRGTTLFALLDLCLAATEPQALVERYAPQKSTLADAKWRLSGARAVSNAYLVQIYRMACGTLGAFALHSSQ